MASPTTPTEDIKSSLYQLLAKTKRLEPKYKYFYDELPNGTQLFSCELTVHGFKFVANSYKLPSKKQAQTEAARQFCLWLVENGHYPAECFPQLCAPPTAPPPTTTTTNETTAKAADKNGGQKPQQPKEPSEAALLAEDIKCRLHAVLGKAKWGLPEYKYHTRNDGRQYFECECHIPRLEHVVHSGRAQTKKECQKICAMKMAQFLVDSGNFPEYEFPHLAVERKEEERKRREREAMMTGLEDYYY